MIVVLLFGHAVAGSAIAEVIHIQITSREPFAEHVTGKIGPYERLRGRVVYALDPEHDANKRIVDLETATPNEDGRVEFFADLEILAPVDRDHAQSTVLYVVNGSTDSKLGVGSRFERPPPSSRSWVYWTPENRVRVPITSVFLGRPLRAHVFRLAAATSSSQWRDTFMPVRRLLISMGKCEHI